MKAFNFISMTVAGLSVLTLSSCGRDAQQVNAEVKMGEPTSYLSRSQVRQHVINAGFQGYEIDTMVCLAFAESTYDAWALSYAGARGLFQIMPMHVGTTCPGIGVDDLWNPSVNARCALKVFLAQGFDAWDPYYFSYGSQYNRTHSHNYLACMEGRAGF